MKLLELFDKANNGDYKWDPTPMQIEEALIRECSKYFHECGLLDENNQLWRGMHLDGKGFIRVDARKEKREPLHTPVAAHDIMNNFFKEKFGWAARDGMFATGSRSLASQFGPLHAVFPIGDFNFLWSPEIKDATADFYIGDFNNEQWEEDEGLIAGFESKLAHTKWKTDDLPAAINSKGEIMIDCDAYFVLSADKIDEIDWHFIFDSI